MRREAENDRARHQQLCGSSAGGEGWDRCEKETIVAAGHKGAVSVLVSAAGHSAAAFKVTAASSEGKRASATGTGSSSS
jgi:hypothetical protein